MGWNTFLRSAGIREFHFRTYDNAVKHFNSVKPIRGRKEECRPFGVNRGYTQCKITHDALADKVTAMLYDTECVSIFADKTLHVNYGGWLSPSTTAFIEAVLPTRFGRVYVKRGRAIYVAPNQDNTTPQREYPIPKEGIWIQANEDWSSADIYASGENKTLNKAMLTGTQYVYKADRRAMNGIRKTLKPLIDYIRVTGAMNEVYEGTEMLEVFPEVAQEYLTRTAKIRYQQELAMEEQRKSGNPNMYARNTRDLPTQYLWAIESIIPTMLAYPTIGMLSEFSNRLQLHGIPAIADVGKNRDKSWLDSYATNLGNAYPRYIGVLHRLADLASGKFKQDGHEAMELRKTILSIVVTTNYRLQSFGYGTSMVMDNAHVGDDIIEVPKTAYQVPASAIENYVIELIKYLYADVVFKKEEVPLGVLPSVQNMKYMRTHEYLVSNTPLLTARPTF
jgi:hypothetical protein